MLKPAASLKPAQVLWTWSNGFPIQGSCVQNHWVAPRTTQASILPWLIKLVPGISWNLVVKSKLPPSSVSVVLGQFSRIHKKGP